MTGKVEAIKYMVTPRDLLTRVMTTIIVIALTVRYLLSLRTAAPPITLKPTPTSSFTPAFWALLTCRKDMPVGVARTITKAVFENLNILHKIVAAAKDIAPKSVLKFYGSAIPYYEDALKYFKEDMLR